MGSARQVVPQEGLRQGALPGALPATTVPAVVPVNSKATSYLWFGGQETTKASWSPLRHRSDKVKQLVDRTKQIYAHLRQHFSDGSRRYVSPRAGRPDSAEDVSTPPAKYLFVVYFILLFRSQGRARRSVRVPAKGLIGNFSIRPRKLDPKASRVGPRNDLTGQ